MKKTQFSNLSENIRSICEELESRFQQLESQDQFLAEEETKKARLAQVKKATFLKLKQQLADLS